MIHTISGNNFHGDYSVKVIGPAAGFTLSKRQATRITRALCSYQGCQCGGGYGAGRDSGSARMEWVDYDKAVLIPSP